jgi:membrane glycosyltransferase
MDQPHPDAFDLDRLAERLGAAPGAPLAMPTQDLGRAPGRAMLAPPERRVLLIRAAALAFSLAVASAAFHLFLRFGLADGAHWLDWVRAGLIWLTTWWLAWGAAQAGAGLQVRGPAVPAAAGPLRTRTVILVPVCNEDPETTFARIAAMDTSLAATGESDRFAFAVLSDTRDPAVAAAERMAFLGLVAERDGEGRMFYRRRTDNRGRKAGNIEDFLTRHGGRWDFALVLDADSLMEGATMVEMARRMEAAPRLGLLQTLPRIVRAGTLFGRAQAFSAALFAPVFARGQAAMQGHSGPFWGHNAILRIPAFTQACGLPQLPGRAPFGGAVLSHDYVEAALLARAGWQVRLDTDLAGSFEEGPANLLDHAKRDRRWAQGNLQHIGVIGAAGLTPWHRFTLLQGIFAYLAPLFWIAFMVASIAATLTAQPPDFFVPGSPTPVFPVDRTGAALALVLGIFGLLFVPKLLIAAQAVWSGRAAAFGGGGAVLRRTLGEIALSSLTAPVHLMFTARAVLQVLLGRDGGWPASRRECGRLSLTEAWTASRWIALAGLAGLTVTAALAPALILWLLPVLLPMAAAPLAIAALSRSARAFATPEDLDPSAVLRRLLRRLGRPLAGEPSPAARFSRPETALARVA